MKDVTLRTIVAAIIGLAMIWFLARSISARRFRELKWPIVISAALFWGGLTTLLVIVYWDNYFALFKPDWLHWWNPILAAVFYAPVGLLLWWLAGRTRSNPAVLFCVMGGLWSIPEHLLAIFRFNILDIPLLQDTSASEILIFAFFEYIIFWGLVLGLAGVVRSFLQVRRSQRAGIGDGPEKETISTASDVKV